MALAGAASGLGDDDLEDAGQRDSPQFCDLGRYRVGLSDGGADRTARLLALVKKGDDAFNTRDFAAVDKVHHPNMVAYITGLADPSTERKRTPR